MNGSEIYSSYYGPIENITFNWIPTHNTPLLESESGNDLYNDTLTCYNQSTADDDDDVKNIFDWRRNGTSMLQLNLPFEGGSTSTYAKDYSTYNHYLNITNSPTWVANGSFDGFGTYDFDGTNDLISIKDNDDLSGGSTGSVGAWIKLDSDQEDNEGIIHKGHEADFSDEEFSIQFWGTNEVVFLITDGPAYDMLMGPVLDTDTWYHVAATWNSTHYNIYLDGSLNVSGTHTVQPISGDGNLMIGCQIYTNYCFDGPIDEIFFSQRELSAEQIQNMYDEQTNILDSKETIVGDEWTCAVTPNDKQHDGIMELSNTLTIWDVIQMCNPILNVDWIISNEQICDNKNVTTGTGNIEIVSNGILKLINNANVVTNSFPSILRGQEIIIERGSEIKLE